MIKERPILFSGPMVRAILGGRKTQTRRPLSKVDAENMDFFGGSDQEEPKAVVGYGEGWAGPGWYVHSADYPDEGSHKLQNKYGAVGDRLWVREAWWHYKSDELEMAGFSGGTVCNLSGKGTAFHANDSFDPSESPKLWRKRPSIHMPRWAARITLEITGIRAERLHSITDEDARAEGIEKWNDIADDQRVPGPGFDRCRLGDQPHRLPFAYLWDDINEKRAPWDSNPWVWVVNFRRVP